MKKEIKIISFNVEDIKGKINLYLEENYKDYEFLKVVIKENINETSIGITASNVAIAFLDQIDEVMLENKKYPGIFTALINKANLLDGKRFIKYNFIPILKDEKIEIIIKFDFGDYYDETMFKYFMEIVQPFVELDENEEVKKEFTNAIVTKLKESIDKTYEYIHKEIAKQTADNNKDIDVEKLKDGSLFLISIYWFKKVKENILMKKGILYEDN